MIITNCNELLNLFVVLCHQLSVLSQPGAQILRNARQDFGKWIKVSEIYSQTHKDACF